MTGVDIKITIGFDLDDLMDQIWDKAQDISNDYRGAIVKEDYASGFYIVSFESDTENQEHDIENIFFDMGNYLNKKHLKYEVQYYEGS